MELTLKHRTRTLCQSGGASFRVAELDLKQTELVLEQAELIIIAGGAQNRGAEGELLCALPQFKN